jgi:pimeloyl-ACP methyl ester carboxylesterase
MKVTNNTSQQKTTTDTLLPHSSINENGHDTILLLHGGGSTRSSWDAVVSHIPPTYHILIPDLPSHGAASSIKPFTLSTCTSHLAPLILAKAHKSRTHLVGISIGAYCAIDLATNYPQLVSSVFASGYNRFTPSPFTPLLGTAAYGLNRLPDLLPKAVTKYFMDGIDVTGGDDSNSPSYPLHREFMALLFSGTWPAPWGARTVIVAATKGGIVPSFDRVDVARRLAEICVQGGNKEVRAVQYKGMRHPWNAQDPKLFADALCAFIERRPLPDGSEEI